jgi:hypothetical protein
VCKFRSAVRCECIYASSGLYLGIFIASEVSKTIVMYIMYVGIIVDRWDRVVWYLCVRWWLICSLRAVSVFILGFLILCPVCHIRVMCLDVALQLATV